MKNFAPMTILFGLACGVSFAAPATDRAHASAEIRRGEVDWANCLVTPDAAVAQRILAEDFVGVETDGSYYNKADEIRKFQTGSAEFVSMNVDDMQIRFYGDVAIVQGHESFKRKKDGGVSVIAFTDSWVLLHGKWQVVSAEDLEVLSK